MAKTITKYDIVLSCPTDVEVEKEVIQRVIEDFNRTIGDSLNINLNLKHWTTDSFAQSGGAAQDLLNKQFIDDSDMIICIFWGRMGTPTDSYESGTAEEMQKAVEKGKQVFLYFSNAPIAPRDLDGEQFARVKKFEKKIQDLKMIYYKNYSNIEEFKNIITTDLNLYFLNAQQLEKDKLLNKNPVESNLVISGTEHKKIIDKLSYYNNYENFKTLIENIKNSILENISKINKMELKLNKPTTVIDNSNLSKMPTMSFIKSESYQYSDEYVNVITDFSKEEQIELNEDFFEVGNLKRQENLVYLNGITSRFILVGSEKEKLKQKEIKKLVSDIYEYLDWVEYSKQFKEINFIRLALSNKGTIYESDITVTLKFPKISYIPFEEIIAPGINIIQGVIDQDFIRKGFGDFNSVEVNSYNYPVTTTVQSIKTPQFPGHSYSLDYNDLVEDYFAEHTNLRCFEEYIEDGFIIQKYHFEELKQHTSISFPMVLLFNNSCKDLDIDYEIISKNNPEIKKNSIGVE